MSSMTADQIIDGLGGRDAAADLCGITADAVRKWTINGVPPKHWPLIVQSSGGRISYDLLARSTPLSEAAA